MISLIIAAVPTAEDSPKFDRYPPRSAGSRELTDHHCLLVARLRRWSPSHSELHRMFNTWTVSKRGNINAVSCSTIISLRFQSVRPDEWAVRDVARSDTAHSRSAHWKAPFLEMIPGPIPCASFQTSQNPTDRPRWLLSAAVHSHLWTQVFQSRRQSRASPWDWLWKTRNMRS